MSGATGNPQWHEGQIAQNPSNTARRNPKPDKHHVESRDNLVEISEESLFLTCFANRLATPGSRNRRSIREPGRVLRIVGTGNTEHRSLGDVSMRKDVTQRQQLVDDGIDALRHRELAGIETDLGVQGGL